MDKQELAALIDNEERTALGPNGDISAERAKALKYYNGEPLGNEVEGRSQVVSSDVFDVVEGMIPPIIKVFASTNTAVEFEPVGEEDEEVAKQATAACNYVFYKQNNGVLILYSWIKDGLLGKNGTVKWYYEDRDVQSKEYYEGATEEEYQALISQEGVEVLEHSEYEDEDAKKQIEQRMQQLLQSPQFQALQGQVPQPPIPKLHDVKVRVTTNYKKVCIVPVPPEEFVVSASHNSIDLEDCPFCEHRTQKTYSQLREMGFSEDELAGVGDGDNEDEFSGERQIRREFAEATAPDNASTDPAMRKVWVSEGYIRADMDGDGVAELIRFIKAGKKVLEHEEADEINFASFSPIVMPHRFTGVAMADKCTDFQEINSVLWRQALDNLYLTNNPRHAVIEGQANLDDLLTSRPGGVVRMRAPGAVEPLITPFVAQHAFPMLEYNESRKENRTGVTRYSQGTDADSLNKTAHGIQMIQNAAQQRPELIARMFAETGFKRLMRGIKRTLYKSGLRKLSIRLNGKYVNVDPREWKTEWDMTVNVGLGTGNKDQQLVHLQELAKLQLLFMQAGKGYMVSDENLYHIAAKTAENSGFKHVEAFFTHPKSVPEEAKKPQPSPDMLKLQVQAQHDDKQLQTNAQLKQAEIQTTVQSEQQKIAIDKYIAELEVQSKERIALAQIQADKEMKAMEINAQAQMKVFEANNAADTKTAELTFEKRKLDMTTKPDETMVGDVTDSLKKVLAEVKQDVTGTVDQQSEVVNAVQQQMSSLANQVTAVTKQVQKIVEEGKKKPRVKKGTFNGKPFEVREE